VFGAMLQGTTSSQVWASAVGSQPKGTAQRPLQPSLQGASVTLHIILLGVGGTIFNTHTLKPFKELGLDSQRVTKLASELHVHSVNFAAKLVHTRRALSSTVIDSHQEPVSGQACNLLDPSFPFQVEGLYGTRYQSGSSSLINVGSGFHCLRSFFFSFFSQPHVCERGRCEFTATCM